MTAIAKVVLPPPGIIRNGAMKQVNRLGEDNFNDGHDRFLAWKKNSNGFLSVKGSRHFPRVRFLSEQFYFTIIISMRVIFQQRKNYVWYLDRYCFSLWYVNGHKIKMCRFWIILLWHVSPYHPESFDGFVKNKLPGKLLFFSIIKQFLCIVRTYFVPRGIAIYC